MFNIKIWIYIYRSKYLLFIKLTNNEVYFIDILKHNSDNFLEINLLEILDRNWHFLLEKNMLFEVEDFSELDSKEKIKKIEKMGLKYYIK